MLPGGAVVVVSSRAPGVVRGLRVRQAEAGSSTSSPRKYSFCAG